MKKLIAMIGAVAMSFGLFAATTQSYTISFEQAEVSKGVDTSTMLFTPPVNAGEWAWAGDPLPITAYGEEPTFAYGEGAFARRSGFDAAGDNFNYLPLETGTDKLVRSMNGNIYLDQLVKFTGFEDPQTNLVEGTKIAIWMSEFEEEDESTTTNLYVTVGKVDAVGGVEQIALKIDPIAGSDGYELNTWYRLSIKSLGNVFTSDQVAPHAGFLVYVNGQQVKSSDADATILIASVNEMDGIAKGYMAEGQLFTAIDDTDATFATVGYQGIGAVDDIFIDAEGPKFCQTVDVDFVLPEDDDGNPTIQVDYVMVGGTRIDTFPISVPDGTVMDVYFSAIDGKKITTGTSPMNVTITSDEATVDLSEVVAEDVVATLTPAVGDATELAQSELAAALAALNEGDVIATVADCSTDDYAFTSNTSITGTETSLAVVIGNVDEDPGSLEIYIGVAADFSLAVAFEEDYEGTILFAGDVDGSFVAANGTVEVSDNITLGEGAIFKAATIDLESDGTTISIVEGSKVMETTGALTDTQILVPDDYELDVSDEDAEGYYTYTAKAVVPPASGFMVILAGQTEGQVYDTLADALDNVENGATIKLLADVTDAVGIVVDTKKSFTIDFDSHVYTVNKPGAGSTGTQTSAFQFIKGQTIVLKNGTIQAHVDNLVLAEAPAKNIKRFIQSYADLTLVDMTLDGTNLYLNPADNAMCEFANGEVSIEGATSILANKANLDAISIDTWKGKYPNGVSVTIDTTGTISSVKVWTEGTGDFTPGVVALEGGTITELKVDGNDADYEIANNGATVTAPAGYTWEEGILKAYVAQIKNGDSFTTLAAAFAAAETGSEIVLLKSASGAGIGLWKENPKTLTLDLGDNTYTCTSPAVGSKGTETQGFHIEQGSALTVKNGTITSSGDQVKMLFQNYVDLTLDGVTLDGSNLPGTGRYVLSNNSGAVILQDCTIRAKEGDVAFDTCKYRTYDAPTVEVKGESVINGNVELSGGNLTLTAGTLNGVLVDAGVGAGVVTKTSDFVATEPEGYTWEDNVLKQLVASVTVGANTTSYTTAVAALAAVQDLEKDSANFPIVAKALVADLAVVGPNGVTIVLAKDETITINANSWVFSGGATISDGPIALAAGATFTVVGQIANYTTVFSAPTGYEVTETANGEGKYTYSASAIPTYTVAAISVANASVVATNKTAGGATFALPADLLRDTEIAVTVTPNANYEYATTPAGWTKNGDGSISTNATVTANLTITVAAPTAAITPVDPETPKSYDSKEAADAAADAINANKETLIKTPEGAVASKYTKLFTAVVTADNDVVVELNEDGTNALKTVADTIKTAVANKLGDIAAAAAGGNVEVVVTGVEPGFWYGVAATADLTTMGASQPGEWKQATTEGVTLTVTKPATGNAAFFQTRVKVK